MLGWLETTSTFFYKNIALIENSLYWPYKSEDGDVIQNGKTDSDDIFGNSAPIGTKYIANKYLEDWKTKVSSTASTESNARMTATLMDTNLWSYSTTTSKGFTNSTKVSELTTKASELVATGGPTLEMWVKSWNQKHGSASSDASKLQIYYDSDDTGYFVGTAATPSSSSSYDVCQGGTTGYTDKLYFSHPADSEGNPDTFTTSNDCRGYWLASPSAWYGYSGVMCVYYDGSVVYHNCIPYRWLRDDCGVRPVVCLPSDITATWNETDSVWNIIKKQ